MKPNRNLFSHVSKKNLFITLALISTSFLAQCKKKEEDNTPALLALLAFNSSTTALQTTCTTNADGTVDSTLATIAKGSFSICKPASGVIKHYRIEGLKVSTGHYAFTVYAGFPENYSTAPTQSGGTLTAGQFAMSFYSGSGTTFPVPGFSYASYGPSGTKNLTSNGNTTTATPAGTSLYDFISTTVDVCFDLTSATPPKFTIWVTGQNGAVCKTKTNLTLGTAVGTESSWSSSTSALATQNSYFGLSSATGIAFTKIVSSSESVLP
ncbi:hypothetical protein [Leptospira sp. 'Mane']|uniref:hypothetical protein n=1 Tax=Leptospira sp. 'Mane' TaxID=3387407 RepID=UPI00398A96F0